MKLSVLVSAAAATEKNWLTKEWQVQDAYFADQEITLQDPKARSNRQWHDCGDKPPVPWKGLDVRCNGTVCAAVCPIGWRSMGRWKIQCKADNTWAHSEFSPCVTCPDMSDELAEHIVEAKNGAVSQSIFSRQNLPVTQFFCGKSTDKLLINGRVFNNGGQKRNVKCFCKNGQNGDPAWKKSCNWSFQGKPWTPAMVKTVSCKDKKVCVPSEKYPAPAGYTVKDTSFGRVYYKIHDGLHNIGEARDLCSADASFVHLPIPKSKDENKFYYNLVGQQTAFDMWLGISDEVNEGVWLGDDGKPVTWFNWRVNEPNNWGTGEHWLEMDLTDPRHLGTWNDWFYAADKTERLNYTNENKVICTFVLPKKC